MAYRPPFQRGNKNANDERFDRFDRQDGGYSNSSTNRWSNVNTPRYKVQQDRPFVPMKSEPDAQPPGYVQPVLEMEEFPSLSKPSVKKQLPEEEKPKKPTFAQLANEWNRKIQEEKAKEEAEAAERAKYNMGSKEREEKEMLDKIKRMSIKRATVSVDTKQLDIGCHVSDHSENEEYNSQDDQVYEEEDDDEQEEDLDADWDYRKNKNEMY